MQYRSRICPAHSNNSSTVADEFFECVWPFCVVGAYRANNHITLLHIWNQNESKLNFIQNCSWLPLFLHNINQIWKSNWSMTKFTVWRFYFFQFLCFQVFVLWCIISKFNDFPWWFTKNNEKFSDIKTVQVTRIISSR